MSKIVKSRVTNIKVLYKTVHIWLGALNLVNNQFTLEPLVKFKPRFNIGWTVYPHSS